MSLCYIRNYSDITIQEPYWIVTKLIFESRNNDILKRLELQ